MLDKTTAIQIAKRYAQRVVNELNPSYVILYGSYVNGIPTKDSDLDIAVVIDNFSGDYLETSALLFRLCRDIDAYVEPILLDSAQDPSGFFEEVMRTGIVLNS